MKKNIKLFIVSILMFFTLLNVKSQTVGCTGTSLDPGGAGNYANNANFTQTFCSNNGQPIYLIFNSFNLENNWDFLYIYNGNSTAAPQIGPNYTGTTSPGTVIATGTCITVRFTSDGSVTQAGWSATIGCGTPPPPPPPPANNNCAGAIPITPGATCTATSATVLNATQSVAGCAGTANDDVWFSFVATGVTQQIGVNAPTGFDPVVQLYSGGCGALTSLSCNDASFGNGANGTGNFNGLTAGQTYYYRVYDFFGGMPANPTFSTCVTIPPPPGAGQACNIPNSFCSETIIYPAGTGGTVTAPAGPAYGCLGSQPNPAWFNMQVAQNGPMDFNIFANSDIDFIIWGPFTTPTGACLAGLTAANIVDCSFSGTNNEFAQIPNAIVGQYYIVMITNYSGATQNITFSQPLAGNPGVGLGNCDILCNISALTATPGACQLGSNTYNVTGTITTVEPPTSGILTISSSCGGTPFVVNQPFATSMTYTITGAPSNGAACTITAAYSADGSCTRTATLTAPAACGTCTLTASNTGPYCEGATISLTTTAVAGATYAWSGPNGFTATGQSVTIPASTIAMAGTYSVTATAGPAVCLSTTSVTVNAIPTITVNSPTICFGGTATLTAAGGTTYSWNTGSTTNPLSVSPAGTTSYTVTGTSSGCFSTAVSTVTVAAAIVPTINSPTICVGQSAILTATGGTTYSWDTGATDNPLSVSPATTTSYTVTANTGGCIGTAVAIVTVNPLPVVTVNSPTICVGQTAALTTAGATTYLWDNGSSSNPLSVSPATTSSYTVTGDLLGCTSSATAIVTVNPLPVITVNSPTICAGQSATLTAAGATTYLWNSGSTTNPETVTPATTASYTVTGDLLGCISSATSTVTVVPNPVITVNSPTICSGENGFLTASGATILTWSPATNLSSTTGANVTSNSTNTIIYTVTGIEQGCTSTATATLTVNPTPVLSVNSATYCEGGSATLTVTGATNYVWSPATGLNSTTNGIVTANPTVTTIYSISGAIGSCNATATATVTVNQNPTVYAGVNDTICLGSSTAITATGGFSYVWNADASLSSTNIASPTATPTTTTTYSVTGTDINGCLGTDNVTILVPPTFTLTPTAIPATCFATCNGAAAVNASPITGTFATYSYAWSTGSTAQIINGLCAGTYNVVVRDLASCIQNTSVTITQPAILSIAESSNTPVICNGGNNGTASVTVSGGTAPYNYFWQTIGTASASNNNLTAGTYTVSAVDVNGCNTNTTITITAPQALSLNPVIGNTICIGQNTNLIASANGGVGAYVFSWTDGTNTFNGSTINLNPTTTTSYTVSAIDANNCIAINTQSVTVTVNPPLTMNFISSYAICEGAFQNVDVSGAGGSGTRTFTWNPMTGVTLLNASGSSAKLNPTLTTNYTVSINDNCGTPTADTNFILTINPKPILSINPAVTSGCQPLEVNFTGSSSSIPVQCTWDFGGNVNSNNCNPTRVFADDGSYLINYSVTDINGCSNSINSNVTVFPVPNAIFTASPQPTTIIDPEITFTNITNANIVSQTWFFNDSLGTNSILPTPSYIYPAAGEYFVTLVVETDKGCLDTVTQPIVIDDYYVVYVPNAFSPDNDGYNDNFTAYGTGITEFKMGIYDRWGGKIIETDDLYKGWDGKKSGEKVEKGVYIYRMEIVNFLGEKKLLSGHVTVVR